MTIYETLPSGIKIVEYEPSLAAGIADMWNVSAEDWGGGRGNKTADQVISDLSGAANLNLYIAMDGDLVVGYCSLKRDYHDANTLYIQLLGVRAGYKNKKIGKALVLSCVNRTRALGYAQINLHTWSGNTAAVPLYKKCGFLWEDRSSGVHLVNFIPTVLPLFPDFFSAVDWYADAVRALDIAPDGKKTGDFELLTYAWEKGSQSLSAAFERTGRRICLVETPDYKITLTAQGHALAYGLDYPCAFTVENKSGKDLHLTIHGQNDGNIAFDYHVDTAVAPGVCEFNGTFYVGEIDKPQDSNKRHPCVLAKVVINGQTIPFGLGIEAKFPLTLNLHREVKVDQVGLRCEAYLGIESALPQDAAITLEILENRLIAMGQTTFTANIPPKGKVSLPTTANTLALGAETLNIPCKAVFADGNEKPFTVPLTLTVRGLTGNFSYENMWGWNMVNGPWQVTLRKGANEANIHHMTWGYYSSFLPPKFGTANPGAGSNAPPSFDEEFNLIAPTVTMYSQDNFMVMEAEYVSEKFAGMVVTQVFTLCASGILTRRNRVENRGAATNIALLDTGHVSLGLRTLFGYNGQMMRNQAPPNPGPGFWGTGGITQEKFDENWIFEDGLNGKTGYAWAQEYRPKINYEEIAFEFDLDGLAPGQTYETKPVLYTYGVFSNYNDFRNYARGTFRREIPVPDNAVDVRLNHYNPFATGPEVTLDIVNNREWVFAGELVVSGDGWRPPLSQTNPQEERVPVNTFRLPTAHAHSFMENIHIDMHMSYYDSACDRTLFFPKGEVTFAQDGTAHICANGSITFKADPAYSHGCYSLTDGEGQEWLLSRYPNHEAFTWWNPFLGGITTITPGHLNAGAILKEERSACFAERRDNHGNLWQGICTTLSIQADEARRGMVVRSYYLTLPGLPLLCCFYELENGSGAFATPHMGISMFFNFGDGPGDVLLDVTRPDRGENRLRLGLEGQGGTFDNVAVVRNPRATHLYAVRGISPGAGGGTYNFYQSANNFPLELEFSTETYAQSGGVFTAPPAFILLTEKDLPTGALTDFERIRFHH